MILIGFTCTGTFQLWLNCAQNFAKENVGWADPSIMQTWYSAGTLIALVVTALLTRKIKDVRFIVIYPVICPENQGNRHCSCHDRIFPVQLHDPDRCLKDGSVSGHAHEHRAHGYRGRARSLCKSPLQKDGGACKRIMPMT